MTQRSLFFVGRLLSLALGATACASTEPETASSTESEVRVLDTPILRGTEKRFSFEISGSGAMPVGSRCVPRQETYLFDRERNRLTVSRCVMGDDGFYVGEQAAASLDGMYPIDSKVASADFETMMTEALRIRHSEKAVCEPGSKELLQLSVTREDGSSEFFYDDFYACQAPGPRGFMSGAEPTVEKLRAIGDTLRYFRPGSPAAPTTPGEKLWKPDGIFTITNQGFGDVPVGSECAPGSEGFTVNVRSKLLNWTECIATTPGDPRLRRVSHWGTMSDEELAHFQAAAEAATTTASPACQVRSHVTIVRAPYDEPSSFVDEASSCGAPGVALTNVDGILATVRSMLPQ